jgi:hypothetical protein
MELLDGKIWDSPLAPTPVSSGFITGALNPAAAEWVHAILMGFAPSRIPLVREAFAGFRYPLTCFSPEDIAVRDAEGVRPAREAYAASARAFRPPRGWRGHCEWDKSDDRRTRSSPLVA